MSTAKTTEAGLLSSAPAYEALAANAEALKGSHLRDMMGDSARCSSMIVEHGGIVLDYSRQKVSTETVALLQTLFEQQGVAGKIAGMQSGEVLNPTEGRSVLHTALRAAAGSEVIVDGKNVVPEVHEVLGRIKDFADRVRSGEWKGSTGKALTSVVTIGIGGSYLGPEFVAQALRFNSKCHQLAEGRTLRFLANVDPADVAQNLEGLDPETTLVVIVSKTMTTAETILNAKTVRQWLVAALGEAAVGKHMAAISTNLVGTSAFGIDPANVFGFWDWVGGRYSVTSAVGVLPLALQYGFETAERFLAGARDIDEHCATAPLCSNIPCLLGALAVWNVSFLDIPARAVLPYSQALSRFPAHIQQVDMESNGKRVSALGDVLPYQAGEFVFGEPGTNGQHSFYQLLHQGRPANCEFIGYKKSPTPMQVEGCVANHDELMSNFFAQPDALAFGKTAEECRAQGIPEELVAHKVFAGDRPSSQILIDELTPFSVGQLLSVYENRTVVQGFLWGINSFDQWGVELGKALAGQCRSSISGARQHPGGTEGSEAALLSSGFNSSTANMMARFLA